MSTRERILAAARSLYLEGGDAAVTMRAVATRVGVSATAIYRHFEGRDELVAEVVEEGFRVFTVYLGRAMEETSAGWRLRASGNAYLEFALEKPEMYRAIFLGRPGSARDARQTETFRFLVDRVSDAQAEGVLRPGDPAEIALAIWAQVHGLVALYITGAIPGGQLAFRSIYWVALGRLFGGILQGEGRDGGR